MLRVLKPGGTLGISTADPNNAFLPLSKPYMERLRKTADELDIHPPEYSDLSALTRTKEGLGELLKEAGLTGIEMREDQIPVHFNSPEDWWNYGRGSTWGDLLLADMTEEKLEEFKQAHLEEVKSHFSDEGVKTATPVLFAIAHKPS